MDDPSLVAAAVLSRQMLWQERVAAATSVERQPRCHLECVDSPATSQRVPVWRLLFAPRERAATAACC